MQIELHTPKAHRMWIESPSIVFTLPRFWNQIVTEWCAIPTAAQVVISNMALSSQHYRCIETHTINVKLSVLRTLHVAGSRQRGTWISMKYNVHKTTWSAVSLLTASSQQHPSIIGHRSSYLGQRIQHVWWPRRKSFDNVAAHGGVTVCDFIVTDE